eukprot:3238577-Rhodomonas_salina.1
MTIARAAGRLRVHDACLRAAGEMCASGSSLSPSRCQAAAVELAKKGSRTRRAAYPCLLYTSDAADDM